jgi:F0F1-type ATP synthase membrane subunit b/b'
MWSVDYGKVTPLLVKAIQEQQATIEAQQKQIDELKAQNTALSSELKAEIENLKKVVYGIVRSE